MPWVKLDDHFDEHPKLAEAGPLGIALWVSGLAYCNRNLTDGFIPYRVAHCLLSFEGIGIFNGMQGQDVTCEMVAGILVDAGLWEMDGRDYRVHDYLEFQPSKAEVIAARTNKVEAGRAGGLASAQARAQASATALPQAECQAKSKPVPVPVSGIESTALEREGESTRKKTRAPAPPLPAQIVAFREAAGGTLLPRKATWPAIIRAVPDGEAALATWREVVTAWMCTPYSPQNINGMIDWFNNGIPKSMPRKAGNNGNHQRRVEVCEPPTYSETCATRARLGLPAITEAEYERLG